MNRYPLQPRPARWNAKLSPMLVRLCRPFRLRKQMGEMQLTDVEIRGHEQVRTQIEKGSGVLITPNHPGHADSYCMNAAGDAVGSPFYYMTAWQVLAAHGRIGQWFLQKHGCFSIDREGADREAFRTAVEILQRKRNPLVIFAEGEVYHQNDRVTPFRDGAAAIAIMAAKKAERNIVCIPCAIKYRYVDDPTSALLSLMDRLEEKILWRPRRDLSLRERIYRLADGLIALKELEIFGSAQANDSLVDRINHLADHILRGLESRYELKSPDADSGIDRSTPERVKEIRAAALTKMQSMMDGDVLRDAAAEEQIARDLDDVFLVVQLFSYPGDYLTEDAPIERIAETLDKFEEDVLGERTATIRARRRAVVSFGEPIAISESAPSDGEGSSKRATRWRPKELTRSLENAVQELLDEID